MLNTGKNMIKVTGKNLSVITVKESKILNFPSRKKNKMYIIGKNKEYGM